MPIKNVELIPGYIYHIYNRAVEGNLLFREWANYGFFLGKIRQYLLPEAELYAYCLMPNHYHFLIKITNQNFPEAMQKLALSYVVAYNKRYNRRGRLFDSPYQRLHIKNISHLLELTRYIHLNPIRAGLTISPLDWDYSNYAEFVGVKEVEFTNPTFILDLLSDGLSSTLTEQYQTYREFIQDKINELKDEVP